MTEIKSSANNRKKAVKKTSAQKRKKTVKRKTPSQPTQDLKDPDAEQDNESTPVNGQASDEMVFEVGPDNGKGTRRVTARLSGVRYDDTIDVAVAKSRTSFLDSIAKRFGIDRDELERYHGTLVDGAEEADDLVEQAAADASGDESDGGDGGGGKKSQATELVELATAAELFHTPSGEAYATVEVNGHRETWSVRSRGFRIWLYHRFYLENGKAPGSQAVQDALGVLEGRAICDGPEIAVFIRLARHGDAIYLDLGNDTWEVVEITADGWRILNESPVKFRRSRGMLALARPSTIGDFGLLRSLLNVASNDDWALLCGFLIRAFNPDGPFGVLVFHGPQGAAKSTSSAILRSLIDPNEASLRSQPRNEHDLVIAAQNGWLLTLDNLSYLNQQLSDALCRLSTTGGFATRQLYTDDDEKIFNGKRPIVLNGIEEIVSRSDLLDRALILHLPKISPENRRLETELWSELEAARPQILGGLLDAVSMALRDLPGLDPPEYLPRMADFVLWVTAAEPVLGLERGAFLRAYERNRREINLLAIEASPLIEPLQRFTAGLMQAGHAEWTGTATRLKQHLEEDLDFLQIRSRDWPRNPRALSNRLRRIAPNLPAIGIEVEFIRGSSRSRTRNIRLRFPGPDEECPSADPDDESQDDSD